MNKIKLSIISSLIVLSLISCDTKQTQETNISEDEWTQMEEFHMLMAESFHPYRDSANLEPAKSLASEMLASANKWINSERPTRMEGEEVSQLLNELKSETENLEIMVASANDEEIGNSLNRLHDIFHHLQEKWYKKEEHQ